ncbi:MAG: hypothetical protein KME27_17390 [Lyngbya sp. HA4199-MV5]|nr:hypothetical protein [Lyngbya sp. HA4199-MV5]
MDLLKAAPGRSFWLKHNLAPQARTATFRVSFGSLQLLLEFRLKSEERQPDRTI